jgi:hypothetical protein
LINQSKLSKISANPKIKIKHSSVTQLLIDYARLGPQHSGIHARKHSIPSQLRGMGPELLLLASSAVE